ncbi:unnamed protein product [Calypogeia fissa]
MEWSDLNVGNNECPELPEDSSVEAVLIVNGVKHSDSSRMLTHLTRRKPGINAGHYARELMLNCAELARDSEKDSDAKTVLIKDFSKTKAQGSTAAVVASISNQILLVEANMNTLLGMFGSATISHRWSASLFCKSI